MTETHDRPAAGEGAAASPPRGRISSSWSMRAWRFKATEVTLGFAGVAVIVVTLALALQGVREQAVRVFDGGGTEAVGLRQVGYDRQGRPYMLTAAGARRHDGGDDRLRLDRPEGQIGTAGGSWTFVTARDGLYDEERGLLDLTGDVHLFRDDGYELATQHALVDLRAGTVQGDVPVAGQGPAGELHAQGFRFLPGGESVVFLGPANVLLVDRTGGGDGVRGGADPSPAS